MHSQLRTATCFCNMVQTTSVNPDAESLKIGVALYSETSSGLIDGGQVDTPLFQFQLETPAGENFFKKLLDVLQGVSPGFPQHGPSKVAGSTVYISNNVDGAKEQLMDMLAISFRYLDTLGWQLPKYNIDMYCNCCNIKAVFLAPPPVCNKRVNIEIAAFPNLEDFDVSVLNAPVPILKNFIDAGFCAVSPGGLPLRCRITTTNETDVKKIVFKLVVKLLRCFPSQVHLCSRASQCDLLVDTLVNSRRVIVVLADGSLTYVLPLCCGAA